MGCSSSKKSFCLNENQNKKDNYNNHLKVDMYQDDNDENEFYIPICLLGKNRNCKVIKVRSNIYSKNYALKIVNIDNDIKKCKNALNEYKRLKECYHPNIIHHKQTFKQNKNNITTLNIVTEYITNGNIKQKIDEFKTENKYFEEKTLIYWLIQVCLALSYLHKKHIIHRNIKPSNIYLTKSGLTKIGDLNLSKKYNKSDELNRKNTIVGTEYYMSPEMKERGMYNEKTDIYSLGKTFYQLINNIIINDDSDKHYSKDFLNLINSFLNESPNERPNAEDILNNPIIKDKMRQFLEDNKFSESLANDVMNKFIRNEIIIIKQNEDIFIKIIKKELEILYKERNEMEVQENNKNMDNDLDILMCLIYKRIK